MNPKPRKETEKKLPEPGSKAHTYFVERLKGNSGVKAAEIAGYSGPMQASRVEHSKGVAKLKEYYKDKLQDVLSIETIASEHAKVITQDSELGPKIAAIKMALDKIEPPESVGNGEDDRVMVILK